MDLDQISRMGSVAGGSPGTAAALIAADWQTAEEPNRSADRTAPSPSRGLEVGAFPRRLLWPTLFGSLVAGVGVAILANAVLRPELPSTPGTDSAAVAPLGLLAAPTATGGSRDWSNQRAGTGPSESDRVEITDVEAAAEVFVPVPDSAIGPPQPAERMPL